MTVVEILNSSLDKVAEIRNLYPINRDGFVLRYSKELSDHGFCTFRVSTKDPIFDALGDILVPHQYHIRIKRDGTTVWAGAIVDNPDRNKKYVEVRAAEYEFYLGKMLIRRDSETTTGDGKDNYRTFTSGTMASAVTTLIQNATTDFGTIHPLGAMTINTVENPDYPLGFKNSNNVPLIGEWSFSSDISLQFDYHSVAYVLKAFALYTSSDFEVNEALEFNFKKFLGNKQTGITFQYGTFGNIVDYNVPRLGQRMSNDVWGIAADSQGKILHVNQRDESSVQTYGLLQGSEAFADVKDTNMLKTRINESLYFTKTPTDAPVNIVLNEKSYPLGQYNIGDIVTVKITDNVINFHESRRIVGITVLLHNTGREMITVQTNKPRLKDIGA